MKEKSKVKILIDEKKVECQYLGYYNDYHVFKILDKNIDIDEYLVRNLEEIKGCKK